MGFGFTVPSNEFVYYDEGLFKLRWADVWEALGVPENEELSTRIKLVAPKDDDAAFLNDEDVDAAFLMNLVL